MQNLKIKVNTAEENREVQELLFELGCGWASCGKNYNDMIQIGDYIFLADCNTINYGLGLGREETTLAELRDMVVLSRNDVKDATHIDDYQDKWLCNSQGSFNWCDNKWIDRSKDVHGYALKQLAKKEWIYKDGSGEYVSTSDAEVAFFADDAIEIPKGAEKATLCGTFIAFWKHGAAIFIGDDTDWDYDYNLDCQEYLKTTKDCGSKIIWQRPTQPEALPFIDDNPQSLNEQYAEIEQVRQQSIEATLAERGSRYGDFESVAETTRALMLVLDNGDTFNKLSASQYEALHMICSKMARIVNGDPDYRDNWHDIGGYAKLVENNI